MLEILYRLGRVCYWTCTVVGVTIIVLGVLVALTSEAGDQPVWIFYFVFGLPIWLLSIVIRYVLSPK